MCGACCPISIKWGQRQWTTAINNSKETIRPLWTCSLSLMWSPCTLVALVLIMLSVFCLFVSLFINLCSQLSGIECSTILREFLRDELIRACAELCLWTAMPQRVHNYASRNLAWFGAHSDSGDFFRTVVICAIKVHVTFLLNNA